MKGGIRQRSPGTWELTLNLGRDAQGIRRRRSLTVRGTKAQAQKRLREILADYDRGIAPPERITLQDWLQRWLPNRSSRTGARAPPNATPPSSATTSSPSSGRSRSPS